MITQERVELASLGKGDLIRGIESSDPEGFRYTDLLIVESGERPVCVLSLTDSNGTFMHEREQPIEGSTTHKPEDVTVRIRTTSPGVLVAGEELMLGSDSNRWILPKCEGFEVYPNNPGQAIE